jgi:hypothetical protein
VSAPGRASLTWSYELIGFVSKSGVDQKDGRAGSFGVPFGVHDAAGGVFRHRTLVRSGHVPHVHTTIVSIGATFPFSVDIAKE